MKSQCWTITLGKKRSRVTEARALKHSPRTYWKSCRISLHRKEKPNSLASLQQCTWRRHLTDVRSTSLRHVKQHLSSTIPQIPSRSDIRRVPFHIGVECQHKIEERLGEWFSKRVDVIQGICAAQVKKRVNQTMMKQEELEKYRRFRKIDGNVLAMQSRWHSEFTLKKLDQYIEKKEQEAPTLKARPLKAFSR